MATVRYGAPAGQVLAVTQSSVSLAVIGPRRLSRATPCTEGLAAVHEGRWAALTSWPGSYGVIACDPGRDRMFIAGDLAGLRPLFHGWSPDLVWASRAPLVARAVVAGPAPCAAGRARREGSRAQLPRRRLAQVPELSDALRPVGWLWDRLSGWQQRQIVTAARAELVRLAGLVPLPQDAPQMLAERLKARIAQSRGLVMIRQPYPWLLHRALVQRPACSDMRCDDGISLDTNQPCESCGNVIHIRRAHRARLAAEFDQEQPGLPAAERQRVLEERLREHTAREVEARQRRHAAQRERSQRMRAAARERAAREQEEAAARERVRQALPCGDCRRPDAAGLCEVCGSRRELNHLIEEAGMCQVSWTVNPRHLDEVASVMNQVREDVLARVAASVGELRAALAENGIVDDPSTPVVATYRGLRAAQEAAAEYRATALAQLTRTPQAQAEGRYAYAAEQSRSHHHDPTSPGPAAASRAAETARTRSAEALLAQRLAHLREQDLLTSSPPDMERLSEALACVLEGAA
ncbi:hypothetical protein [Streptomyces sp. NRRL F-5630]|uniref:hypothetical protein n=1 Tax=Streptomyces sp. NRRL F-5630 TaxID=1463864 RepID=UPI003D71CB83